MDLFLEAFSPANLAALASDPLVWASLATLIALEIVLGIDNLIFISIVTNRLPPEQRALARRVGIAGALILRLALLSTVAFIVKLTAPVFSLFDHAFSWRDLILIGGGLFLVWKATKEIHHRVDVNHAPDLFDRGPGVATFGAVVGQVLLIDMVFSLDSIITAVGMTPHIAVMVIAVVLTVALMVLAAGPLANFVNANPAVIMLALGFLLMIGMVLIAEGFGAPVPKGYIYTAMAFALGIECLNMLSRRAERVRERGEAASSSDIASNDNR